MFYAYVKISAVINDAIMQMPVNIHFEPCHAIGIQRNMRQYRVSTRHYVNASNVVEIRQVVAHFKDVVVAANQHFPTNASCNCLDVLTLHGYVTENVYAVGRSDYGVPTLDDGFIHFFAAGERAHLGGSGFVQEFATALVAEMRIADEKAV